jgi:hypothetical protein
MARRKMIPGKIQMWGSDVHVDWAEAEAHKKIRQQGFAYVATARNNRVLQPSHFNMNNSQRGFYRNCGYLPIDSISNHSRMPLMNNPPTFPNTMPMMNTRSGSYNSRMPVMNTQSGSYNSRMPVMNTQSGSYNSRMPVMNTQSGSYNSRMPVMNNPPIFPNTMPMMNTRSRSYSYSYGMYQHERSSYNLNPNYHPVYQNSGSLNHPANNPARSPFINFQAQPFPRLNISAPDFHPRARFPAGGQVMNFM